MLSALDVVKALGYAAIGGAGSTLDQAGVPREERIALKGSSLTKCVATLVSLPKGKATFLTRKGASDVLRQTGVPREEQVSLKGSTLINHLSGSSEAFGKATFLTRKGVNLLLMSSTRPQAKE